MGIRSVSSRTLFGLLTLFIAACGGGGSNQKPKSPEPVTIEGVWVHAENRDQNRTSRIEPFKSTIVVKGNNYRFYQEKKEVENGTFTFDGKSLVSKNGVTGQEHSTPVKSLTANALTIGDDSSVSIYHRVTKAQFNEYLGIVEETPNTIPTAAPAPPVGAEGLDGFWALRERYDAAKILPAKTGDLVFKVYQGRFESFERGKPPEKGTIKFDGLQITTTTESGTIAVKVKSFGKRTGLVVEDENNGNKTGRAFRRVTEEEFNSLVKGEEPPKVSPAPPEEESVPEEEIDWEVETEPSEGEAP